MLQNLRAGQHTVIVSHHLRIWDAPGALLAGRAGSRSGRRRIGGPLSAVQHLAPQPPPLLPLHRETEGLWFHSAGSRTTAATCCPSLHEYRHLLVQLKPSSKLVWQSQRCFGFKIGPKYSYHLYTEDRPGLQTLYGPHKPRNQHLGVIAAQRQAAADALALPVSRGCAGALLLSAANKHW